MQLKTHFFFPIRYRHYGIQQQINTLHFIIQFTTYSHKAYISEERTNFNGRKIWSAGGLFGFYGAIKNKNCFLSIVKMEIISKAYIIALNVYNLMCPFVHYVRNYTWNGIFLCVWKRYDFISIDFWFIATDKKGQTLLLYRN